MKQTDIIKQRRCVRAYSKKTIPIDILKDIVDCARLAPSANNVQPWEFIVVAEKDTLKKIADITDYGKFIKDAAACIIVICKDTKYYLEDGCAAAENILLAARMHNIGSCWVAGDKKSYAKEILGLLEVPEGFKLISIIPLGYTSKFPEPHDKRTDVAHFEKF